MTVSPLPEADTVDLQELQSAFDGLRGAFATQGGLDLAQRRRILKDLLAEVRSRKVAIAEAVDADFGGRSHHESLLAEVWMVTEALKHSRAHVADWMSTESRKVSTAFLPASARVVYQPKGVVGVIGPWNYPFQLVMLPVIAAIAAGNRVLVKPSELTPRTAGVVRELLAAVVDDTVVRVVEGGPAVGAAFARLPLDHLMFTGSTAVGRLVMMAAAENLTPVTLELGGKSPIIQAPGFSVTGFANRVAAGKCFNAGQTCIAPDYALVARADVEPFVAAMGKAVAKAYPTLRDNADYTAIINEHHLARLQGLLDDAVSKGARAIPLGEGGLAGTGRFQPHLVLDVTDQMALMQEEIFGPLLPVVPYDTLDEALAYVNARPRPLALYYFDHDQRRIDDVLARTWSGGVTVNDVLLHISQEELPFGGIGPSGMGAYHGEFGFRTFSHAKAVFQQARLNGVGLFSPPYGKLAERILRLLIGA